MKNIIYRSCRPFNRFIGALLFLLAVSSTASAVGPKDLREPQPPIVTDDGILFSYRSETTPRYVKIIGDFNDWERSYYMTKNRHGVFVFLYEETGKKGIVLTGGRYRYRFLVDGIWINDPLNNCIQYDAGGTALSCFDVPASIVIADKNPLHVHGNSYVFYYRNDTAQEVYLVGDFNNWNPYSLPMKRNESGLWESEVDILPGSYAYAFIVDGIQKKDPLGTHIVYDRFDREYSKLTLP
ncbi:MAG: hypothetical protein JXQ30_04580 [Spirochaetes bacterium]|nr:hypothetical protein [Spirochaetota bacterium]